MTSRRNKRSRSSSSSRRRRFWWVDLPDEELLDLRFRDLGLKIAGTNLERRIEMLYADLRRRNIRLRPHCWLSREWFVADGVPGIAIPFYLAHPRLMQLEYRQMYEVEGGTEDWCLRILRHEAGHAIDSAFRLHRRKRWQNLFGKISKPYPEYYRPKPYSKNYVLHLDWWYAQSHPTEDFAETFAVWLRPGSMWRKHYKGWPALKKLEYVDELMKTIAGKKPSVTSKERIDPLSEIHTTLREHYRERRARYQGDYPEIYDPDLRRLFSVSSNGARRSAAAFLRRNHPELRRAVAKGTGEHSYTIDQLLRDMTLRCRELNLYVDRPENQVKLEVAILVSVQTINYIHSGQHKVPL